MSPELGTVAPRLAELKDKVERDPKSRLFVQLADEYRRAGQAGEAIAVLRRGLEHHPTYVAASNALGKLYIESGRDADALPVLENSLVLDPQNVVSARLLGDIHYRRGALVDAIRRYKLCRAIAPGDEALDALIETIEAKLGPPSEAPVVASAPAVAAVEVAGPEAELRPMAEEVPVPEPPQQQESPAPPVVAEESSPFEESASGAPEPPASNEAEGLDSSDIWKEERHSADATGPQAPESGDGEAYRTAFIPSAALLAQMGRPEDSISPAAEAISSVADGGGDQARMMGEASQAMTPTADEAGIPAGQGVGAGSPVIGDQSGFGSEPSAESGQTALDAAGEEATLTMAELYLGQGHLAEARRILERLLVRDPGNPVLLEKLGLTERTEPGDVPANAATSSQPTRQEAIVLLREWLSRIKAA